MTSVARQGKPASEVRSPEAARRAPVPAGTRLRADRSLRRFRDGTVLVGGSPLRLLRLRGAGAARVDGWLAGQPVTADPGANRLARQLLDAGLVHPVGTTGPCTPADVTVVVPVHDNASGVARLLDATGIVADRIVVDDGSPTPLPRATVRHPDARGPAAARNTGWRHARTELVAFLDSDTVPEPGWLDAVLPLFADPMVHAVAPRIRSTSGRTVLHRYEADRCALDLGPQPAAVRPLSRVSYVPSAALVVRRDTLSTLDGFDESLRYGEDVDLIWRIVAAGGTVRYQPESVVRHEPRPTLRGWLRQRYAYGTSAATLARRHPGNLASARLSPTTALAWTLAALGRPLAGLGVATAATGVLGYHLHASGLPAISALSLGAKGNLGAARMLADAVRRNWWPLALFTRRGRRLLAAAMLPCVVESLGARDLDPIRCTALRVADDLAYGAGVWAGCLRHRTLEPLLPQFTRQTRRPQ